MSSSKYSRRPRPQQPPAICKRPPIAEPPDTPIPILQALASWQGYTLAGDPVNLDRTIHLTPASLPIGNHYSGSSPLPDYRLALEIRRGSIQHDYWVVLELYYNLTLLDWVTAIVPPDPHFSPAVGTVAFETSPRIATCITALIFL